MDKIGFQQMKFYGRHGVFTEENTLGQVFIVDLELFLDLRQAGLTDELAHTINYADAYAICKQIVAHEQYKLIETVAEKIAARCLADFSLLQEITVRVIKPNPPIAGIYDHVSVEIKRGRTA